MGKKKRNYNPCLIVSRRPYTLQDIADQFSVHIRTVQAWQKSGLTPIDNRKHPQLYMGFEVQRFLRQRQGSRRHKLRDHEFYCPRCKGPSTSGNDQVQIETRDKRIGRDDKLVLIRGVCLKCGSKMCRISTWKKVLKSSWSELLQQGE